MQKVTMEDIENIKCLSEVSFSPDGKAAAFVETAASVKENRYLSNIWVLEEGKARKLTSHDSDRAYTWLDNETILFPGDRKNQYKNDCGIRYTVFNTINIHGGEAEKLFAVPFPAKAPLRLSEDEFLLLGTYDYNQINLEGLSPEERAAAVEKIKEEKDYEVFDELPFWANGAGVVNKLRTRLYRCNIKTGENTILSPEYMEVSGFRYHKESNTVAYFGSVYQWMNQHKTKMYLHHLTTGKTTEVDLKDRWSIRTIDYMGDRLVMAGTTGETYGNNENPTFLLADPQTGAVSVLADLDPSMGSSVGSDCRYGGGKQAIAAENAWYYTETRGYNSYIVRLSNTGETTVVSPMVNGSVDCFDRHGSQLIYIGMRSNGLQEIYTCTEGGTEEKLTSFNDAFLAQRDLSAPKYMSFVDSDGVAIDGWVIEPVGYDPQKTYPAILDVHGGPKGVYGEPFFHEMQLWAGEGYFVFFCNPRGGDGRGNEFADIRGDRYGVWDYNDLMEFTDEVLKKYPQIDKTRLGMTGGSYGGFMANWIIGHTDRFAAVASQRSISNFISKCLTTDIGYYHNLNAIQADPWSSPEKMWHHSPLKYANQCKTPTLFIQADQDYRCWMGDAIQMLTALRMNGVPTRMCLFHGENHELSRSGKPKHRIRRLKEITDWFNQYLK